MSEFAATPQEIERIDQGIRHLFEREEALKREIEFLKSERRALLMVRVLATSSLAPIHRLPDEILGAIFTLGTEGPAHDAKANGFPFLVMLVSRRWHDVAMSTPTVWSRVDIGKVSIQSLFPRITRSGTVPLDIVGEWTMEPHPYIIPALIVLLDHVHRWRSFSLRFTGLTPVRDLLEVVRTCRGDAQRLTSISLVLIDNLAFGRNTPKITLTLNTPNIQAILLHGVELDLTTVSHARTVVIPAPRSHFPWSLFEDLQQLTITQEVDFVVTQERLQYGPPRLPNLQQLVITKGSLGAALLIDMPSLQTLLVHKGHAEIPAQTWEFAPFRPYHPLPSMQRLVLGSWYPTPSPFLLHIMSLMPKLGSLRFESICPEDLFFYEMAAGSLCLYLRELVIWGAQRDPSAAVDVFVRSRSGPKGKLPVPLKGWTLHMDPKAVINLEANAEDSDDYSDDDYSDMTDASK